MKRIIASALCLLMLITLAAPLSASASTAGWYVVDSDSPKGYCYLYSAASDRDGRSRNLGRYDNGEFVYVMNYYGGKDGKYNYCYVQTQDGKTGYMHDYSLTRYYGNVWADSSTGWYVVQSKSPNGYCYLYSKPSSQDGVSRNLGRYNNGEYVYVLEYYGGDTSKSGSNYCYVQTTDGKTGYIKAASLKRFTGAGETDPNAGWYVVRSYNPYGYCYLYSAASDRDGVSSNLGRYDNGEYLYVLEYYGGQDYQNNYCYVLTQDGKYGFVHDYVLARPD